MATREHRIRLHRETYDALESEAQRRHVALDELADELVRRQLPALSSQMPDALAALAAVSAKMPVRRVDLDPVRVDLITCALEIAAPAGANVNSPPPAVFTATHIVGAGHVSHRTLPAPATAAGVTVAGAEGSNTISLPAASITMHRAVVRHTSPRGGAELPRLTVVEGPVRVGSNVNAAR
jgi:hypothetical protein